MTAEVTGNFMMGIDVDGFSITHEFRFKSIIHVPNSLLSNYNRYVQMEIKLFSPLSVYPHASNVENKFESFLNPSRQSVAHVYWCSCAIHMQRSKHHRLFQPKINFFKYQTPMKKDNFSRFLF